MASLDLRLPRAIVTLISAKVSILGFDVCYAIGASKLQAW